MNMLDQGVSIKKFNTFSLPAYAQQLFVANSAQILRDAWRKAKAEHLPFLILGAGSNVLFVENFLGLVVLNRIKGISCTEHKNAWHLHAGAGENWHDLVCYSVRHNMPGLENLALIPGMAGAAPVQNLGAYGVELQKFCYYVDVLDLRSGRLRRLTAEQCQFGYRDSIFKHHYISGYAIVAVGIKLSKNWLPVLGYGDLSLLDDLTVTPAKIFDAVCTMRRNKLPDPAITGNAGSFFKNPVVNSEKAWELTKKYPDAPCYPQPDNQVKLAAGWLIEQCALKGHTIGGAAVHQQQALILINQNNASGKEIVNLAHYVRAQVALKFGIFLEPEVRFIAAHGEVNGTEIVS